MGRRPTATAAAARIPIATLSLRVPVPVAVAVAVAVTVPPVPVSMAVQVVVAMLVLVTVAVTIGGALNYGTTTRSLWTTSPAQRTPTTITTTTTMAPTMGTMTGLPLASRTDQLVGLGRAIDQPIGRPTAMALAMTLPAGLAAGEGKGGRADQILKTRQALKRGSSLKSWIWPEQEKEEEPRSDWTDEIDVWSC